MRWNSIELQEQRNQEVAKSRSRPRPSDPKFLSLPVKRWCPQLLACAQTQLMAQSAGSVSHHPVWPASSSAYRPFHLQPRATGTTSRSSFNLPPRGGGGSRSGEYSFIFVGGHLILSGNASEISVEVRYGSGAPLLEYLMCFF